MFSYYIISLMFTDYFLLSTQSPQGSPPTPSHAHTYCTLTKSFLPTFTEKDEEK